MTENIRVIGAVQGIGYRPFTAKLAEELHVTGEVKNCGGVVELTVSGTPDRLDSFADRLRTDAPQGSMVISVERETVPEQSYPSFRIAESSDDGSTEGQCELPVFPPDIAMCDACHSEMNDPSDRRYRYPLISCASCGPRFSILKQFPYDRDHTTMEDFALCPQCAEEYRAGRRRHAQTISCHDCGPQVTLTGNGKTAAGEPAMQAAAAILRKGGILAVKGIGGYQLLCSPQDEAAVDKLRESKGREKKPFAVMFPDLPSIEQCCEIRPEEEKQLLSSARPIVLLRKKQPAAFRIADSVCGDSRFIGAFLPSVGLQERLLRECGPMIVTSANLSGSPIPTDDEGFLRTEARKLQPDGILSHPRRILRPLDDSVLFVSEGRTAMLRRSRGYVPLPVFLKEHSETPVIFAAGGDLKASFALRRNGRVILSQYFGDLADYAVLQNYRAETADFEKLFHAVPALAVCDLHPRYLSSEFAAEYAEKQGIPLRRVQHHHAHIASVMAEHGLDSCIGIAFDGTGCGTDGQLWGGEYLFCHGATFERMGSLSPVLLAGGDAVPVKASLAADCYRRMIGEEAENPLVRAALEKRINTVESTSMGRLFDAAAALVGIRTENTYEGECAIALENAAVKAMDGRTAGEILRFYEKEADPAGYCMDGAENSPEKRLFLDQAALIRLLLEQYRSGVSAESCALLFHAAVSLGSARIARILAERTGETKIALSGGVFANRLLRALLRESLAGYGFQVYFNEQVPMNDGGISLGQAYLAGFDKAE